VDRDAPGRLGDASYSLYLTHPFGIRPIRNIWMALDGGALPLGFYLIVCALVAIASALIVYRLIEMPTTDALRRPSVGLRGDSPRGRLIAAQPQSAAAGG
jgi:exopolysaccharide production protein ExoZ